MEWTPLRLTTCRAATHRLQKSVMQAFGIYLGMGEAYWSGFIKNLESVCVDRIPYVEVQPMSGMAALARFHMSLLGRSDALNAHLSAGIGRMSEAARANPKRLDFMMLKVYPWAGRANDLLLWPLYSAGFAVVRAVRSWVGR